MKYSDPYGSIGKKQTKSVNNQRFFFLMAVSSYETLHSAVSYALQHTLSKLTIEVFVSAYPHLSPETLEVLREQILTIWSRKAEHEFKKIFHERGLRVKLEDLDRLIEEARERYNRKEFRPLITNFSNEQIVKTATLPILTKNNEDLRVQLKNLKESNDQLENQFAEMKSQFNDDFSFINDINTHLTPLDSIQLLTQEQYESFIKSCLEELAK